MDFKGFTKFYLCTYYVNDLFLLMNLRIPTSLRSFLGLVWMFILSHLWFLDF